MRPALHALASRLLAFIRRRRLDEETRQDCETHLALLTERNLRAGMALDEARAPPPGSSATPPSCAKRSTA
jgi:hypothetical protein